MNKKLAIFRYPDCKYIKQYVDADKTFTVNDNDPRLTPITLPLPEPPAWHLIDGFGLPPEEQYFRPQQIPEVLKKLERSIRAQLLKSSKDNKQDRVSEQKVILTINEYINERPDKYVAEIKWMKRQWYYFIHGYWFFNNGKPTYIVGWHYMYVNWYHLADTKPEYRDVDRRWFLFAWDCFTTTKDIFGNEYNQRTCYGFNRPKHRRAGDTRKSDCVGICIAIVTSGNVGIGIQTHTGKFAEEIFTTMTVPAFKKLPFFFKPMWDGSSTPKTSITFKRPASMTFGFELECKIDYASTANRSYYDGKQMCYLLVDEEGKTVEEDVDARWDVLKQCMTLGSRIIGFSIHPSTVVEMEGDAGLAYYDLCNKSHADIDINELNGQTISGLRNLFIPGWDGLEGFIDKHGISIIETPTKEQAAFIKKKYGAKEYLLKRREMLLKKNTPESLRSYREELGLYPTCWDDCFRVKDGDLGFNSLKLDEAEVRLRNDNNATQAGNLRWKNNIIDGEVEWVPDAEGKFRMSMIIPEEWINRKYKIEGIWHPENRDRFTAAADPFKFLVKSEFTQVKAEVGKRNSKMSNGAGCVFWERDNGLDPSSKELKDYISNRFILTYNYRSSDDDEYAEDMLMMSVFAGAPMYPERNHDLIIKHFVRRGYACNNLIQGYLKYDIDPTTGRYVEQPGWYSSTDTKQDLFKALRNYIEWHIHREKHYDLVLQLKAIKNIEQMTKYDLLTACGGALMSSSNAKIIGYEPEPEVVDLSGWVEKYSY